LKRAQACKGRLSRRLAETVDLLIKGATLLTPAGEALADIAIRHGRIARIGSIDPALAGKVIDAAGLHILPGVIDTQVHFREPGLEHKEDLESGSRSAVMGGVTAVFEMPNTKPATTSAEALADKVARARGRMHCDFAFFVGATRDNVEQLPELEKLPGAAGIKVFMGSSTGDLLVADDDGLRAVLSRTRRRVSVHSEDEPRLTARLGERVAGDPSSHPVWRDVDAAMLATRRLTRIAEEEGARVHLLHVSTAEEIEFLKQPGSGF